MYAVQTADTGELAALRDAARDSRAVAVARRRALSAGRAALAPAQERVGSGLREAEPRAPADSVDAPPAASNGQEPPGRAPVATNGSAAAHTDAAIATDGVAAAHIGRALSKERRRQLSQGKRAVTAAGGALGAPQSTHVNGAGAPAFNGQGAPSGVEVAPDGVAAAHVGRALSKERRRQLSQGKRALTAGAGETAARAADAGALPENLRVDGSRSGREQARARRAEASRFGSAGISRPQREGRVMHAPKVVVSPTQGGQRVTGLRIGPGVRVTGDEAGAGLPVSGTQYIAADGPASAPGAGPKVGLVRTPQGLVVSGTTVRNKVGITGDEAGEHLVITGEADQKSVDDLTPRSEGTFRPAQFPRRADPHGGSAVGTRLVPQPGMAASGGEGSWHPLETTDYGMAVTGTAVGRSGRVTGNEAGACRPITGDQYQGLSSYSSECGGTGGGTAPDAHLNGARLDPVTGGKVTVAQTWGGQRVTGPSVEHRPNVTGDEPGVCRPVTGTAYQGPSSTFGWCEPEEGESAAQRLESRPKGVAVTGNIPMHTKAVTGTERGHGRAVTGTSYYRDMRPAEPAADDWTGAEAFPVALARRLADGQSDDAATQDTNEPPPAASSVPGRITGSFASGEGKVTGNNEFVFRARPSRDGKQSVVTGEGRTEGRTVTGSAWTPHDRVTGTEGYIAAGRNPSEGGGGTHAWAGALKFRDRATPEGPHQNVTGLSGWSAKAAARVTLSGGAQG